MRLANLLMSALIRVYQLLISSLLPAACRYAPSCSQYAREAISLHGAGKGMLMALGRLARCHPWGGHGFDPVPGTESSRAPSLGRENGNE